jgi:Domain of unknown function (DUF4389)
MAMLSADVRYGEPRRRLTNAFRWILAFPHLIVVGVWGYLAEILGVIQWFIVLFTGKRNRGMWDLQWAWLGYSARVYAYVYHLFDEYPRFGTDVGAVPMGVDLVYDEPANRLTNGLRFIWAIPAMLFSIVLAIALFAVLIVTWFVIVITGKQPRGLFDFILNVVRYSLQLNAYILLMTDTYPRWGSGAGALAPATPTGSQPLAPPTASTDTGFAPPTV